MKINSKVVSDKFEDEIVVVSLDTGYYYSFRDSAMEIWDRLENGLTVGQIVKAFDNLLEDEESSIKTFINQLQDEKLIIESEKEESITHAESNQVSYKGIQFAKFEDMSDLIMIDPIHDADEVKGWPNKTE